MNYMLNFAYNTIEIRANVDDRLEIRMVHRSKIYMHDANSIEKQIGQADRQQVAVAIRLF